MSGIFTRYDESNGKIIGTMKCSEDQAALNGPYIEGNYDADKYLIIKGQAVPIDPKEIELKEISRAWVELRKIRSGLLSESDWTQVPDAPVDQVAWAAYRQELRDLPENTADPRQVVWPTPPSP